MDRKKFLPAGALGVSVILHLAIFLAISGVVLIQAVAPKVPFVGDYNAAPAPDQIPVAPPEDPPTEPEPTLGDAPEPDNPMPFQQAPALNEIASANPLAPPVMMVAPVNLAAPAGGGDPAAADPAKTSDADAAKRPPAAMFSPFGRTTEDRGILVGHLYDLKKTPDGQSTGFGVETKDQEKRVNTMNRTMQTMHRNGGDKSYLDKNFFRAPNTLYAAGIFIPPMPAHVATTAFKSEHIVSAPGWMAYYEANITPPESGEYRFVGFADDVMLVQLDGKTVLYAFYPGWRLNVIPDLPGQLPRNAQSTDGRTLIETIPGGVIKPPINIQHARFSGPWMKLEKGEVSRLNVIISESWGGTFLAFLAIEQRNVKHPTGTGPAKQTLLPIFKLADFSPQEIEVIKKFPSDFTAEGPNFGLRANGVAAPR